MTASGRFGRKNRFQQQPYLFEAEFDENNVFEESEYYEQFATIEDQVVTERTTASISPTMYDDDFENVEIEYDSAETPFTAEPEFEYVYDYAPVRPAISAPPVLFAAVGLIMLGLIFGAYQVVRGIGDTAGAQTAGQAPESAAPAAQAANNARGGGGISPIFSAEVQYWADDIVRWAGQHDLDPNLVATVMQIESCGDPSALSIASAQGLFQVMPFHFAAGEQMTDPDTNAARGMAYLREGLRISGGDAGLAMAGYNGGHSVIGRSSSTWANETQRYYVWGSGIYQDVQAGGGQSSTLQSWLNAGGQSLCNQAAARLGLR